MSGSWTCWLRHIKELNDLCFRRENFLSGHTSLPPVGELKWDTRSGMVFSGCGIWPKYSAGFGKTQNFLTGCGIRPLLGKWDSPKSWQCMRYWKRKTLFGMEMTEVRDAWLSWKGSWNAVTRPLFWTPGDTTGEKNVPFGPGDSTPVGNVVVVSEARRM